MAGARAPAVAPRRDAAAGGRPPDGRAGRPRIAALARGPPERAGAAAAVGVRTAAGTAADAAGRGAAGAGTGRPARLGLSAMRRVGALAVTAVVLATVSAGSGTARGAAAGQASMRSVIVTLAKRA